MPGKIQLREAAQLDEARMLLHVGTLGLALLTPSRRLSPVASQLSQRTCSPQMIGSMDRLLDAFRSPDPSELPGVCTHCYPPSRCAPAGPDVRDRPIVPQVAASGTRSGTQRGCRATRSG